MDTGYKGAYGAKMYFTVVGPHGHVNYRRLTEDLRAISETPESYCRALFHDKQTSFNVELYTLDKKNSETDL